jgi:hypothetical protein
MVSFVSYVLQSKNDDTALGDVARDMSQDAGINRMWGYSRLVRHLKSVRADERVYKILELAKSAYDFCSR